VQVVSAKATCFELASALTYLPLAIQAGHPHRVTPSLTKVKFSQVRFGQKPLDKFIMRLGRTIRLSRTVFSLHFIMLTRAPGRTITLSCGNGRALTKCDLIDYANG
jgi:hypothetical protein